MKNQVLLVDDEPNLLHSIRRSLRGRFDLVLAEGGQAAIDQLSSENPYSVIISDMQMPDVDGLKVLAAARKVTPDTIRIMLTGNVDQQTAVDAVNDGAIYRFINKPCPAEKLADVIDEAIKQYNLVTAEKELLSKTLTGCVGILNEVLSLANPKAFGRSGRVRQLTKRICESLEVQDAWQYEIAAMLSQIGSIGFPNDNSPIETSIKVLPELSVLKTAAETGGAMIAKIPRLDNVAQIVGQQYVTDASSGAAPEVRFGSKLLRMLTEYDVLRETRTADQSIRFLNASADQHDPDQLKALSELVLGDRDVRSLSVMDLLEGMILEKDVYTRNGDKLISSGHELTSTLIQRLKAFVRNSTGVREPIVVRCERHALARSS